MVHCCARNESGLQSIRRKVGVHGGGNERLDAIWLAMLVDIWYHSANIPPRGVRLSCVTRGSGFFRLDGAFLPVVYPKYEGDVELCSEVV